MNPTMRLIACILLALQLAVAGCDNEPDRESSTATDPNSTTASVTSIGGTVTLAGVASATFPREFFESAQDVRVSKADISSASTELSDAVQLNNLVSREAYEIFVQLGSNVPRGDRFSVTVELPADLLSKVKPGESVRALVGVNQLEDGEALESYQVVPSVLDRANRRLTIPFNKAWLTRDTASGRYQARIVLGTAVGLQKTTASAEHAYPLAAGASSSCRGKPIGVPLRGSLAISGNPPRGFNPDPTTHPVTGKARPHWGVDLVAPQGSEVLAVGAARVKRVKFSGPPASWPVYPEGGGGGQYVQIELLDDGSIITYMHLSTVRVAEGANVAEGQVIGTSGGTRGTPGAGGSTGPHLHLEYLHNGEIYNNTELIKIDPFPCLGASNLESSIRISDNGNANDDIFAVWLDGRLLGRTPKGGQDTFGLSNLRPGNKTLLIICEDDGASGSDVCTLEVSLGDGLTFTGTQNTTVSARLNLNGSVSYSITVPSSASN